MPLAERSLAYALANPDDALLQLDKYESEKSLLNFMKLGWHALEPGVEFVPNWGVEAICDHLEAVTNGEIRRLLINVPPGCTKALDVNTPILTTRGWKTHGNLKVNDFVFGPDGLPKRVEGVTAHNKKPSYELIFSDDSKIIACADHLWEVHQNNGGVLSKEILETKNLIVGVRPHFIPVAKAVNLPPQHLLIDPYVLGLWLGDGSSNEGNITVAEIDVENAKAYGELTLLTKAESIESYTQNIYRLRVPELRIKLRILNLLNNKHIPEHYLIGSIEQRLTLLQGLMDSDGNCDKTGRCSFSNTNHDLAYGCYKLLVSLGLKAKIQKHESILNGKKYKPSYRVYFTPDSSYKIFRLKHKQERIKTANIRNKRRYLKKLNFIGEQLVNCIQVEGGLYLAGYDLIKTHNSMTVNVFWPAFEWGPKKLPHYRYLCGAHKVTLAERDSKRSRDLINSEWYQALWGNEFQWKKDQSQKVNYENTKTGWRIASAAATMTGQRGDRVHLDDPHTVEGAESDTQRETVLRTFSETIPTRLNRATQSAIIVIMQRVHERDVSGLILAKELGYEHLMLPMEFERERRCYSTVKPSYIPNIEKETVYYNKDKHIWTPNIIENAKSEERYNVDMRNDDGELLDPVRFPSQAIDELKSALEAWGGTYAIAGQLQQRPAPRGGGLFQKDDFQYLDNAKNLTGRVIRGWDLAASDDKKSAYSAGVKMMLTNDKRIIILDVNRFKKTPGGMENEVKATADRDGKSVVIDMPQDPGQAGKTQKAAFAKLLHGYTVRFSPETGSKENRAAPLAAQAEAGNVYLVRGSWNDAFVNEATVFPNSEFKDQVDAASRAYGALIKKKPSLVGAAPVIVKAENHG